MPENYLTSGDLAMWDTARTGRRGYGDDYGCGYGHRGRGVGAAIGLGSAGLGIAIFGGMAIAFGLNAASKARARGVESTIAAQSKTMELIAATVNREAVRQDGVNVDVQQTLRNHATAVGTGGTAAALANAEALSFLQNGGNGGLNSAVGGCNYLRVARVSGSRLCGCDTCEG